MSRRILLAALVILASLAGRAHADGPRKQTGPVDIQARVDGVPHTGEPLSVVVTVTPRVDVSALEVSIVAGDGLAVRASEAMHSYGALKARAEQTITLHVTPQAPGLQLLSVVAAVGGIPEGASRRTITIELAVDGVGTAKSLRRPTPVDATGQRIESLHGRSR